MPRQLRLQYPGAMYHVMSRGDRREKIFLDAVDRQDLRLGCKEADLKSRRKNDPDKLELGARLRRETTLTIKAIAARVCLGTSKAANAKLHRHMREGAKPRKGKARPAGRKP
jgi:hypothetical protein